MRNNCSSRDIKVFVIIFAWLSFLDFPLPILSFSCNGFLQTEKGVTTMIKAMRDKEPAGVEPMVLKARQIRKGSLTKLVRKIRNGRKLTWFNEEKRGRKKQRRRFRKHDIREDKYSELLHPIGHAGFRELASMKNRIVLPPAWKFGDAKEVEALAAMKAILEKDFLELEDKTVCLSNGTQVQVLAYFPDVYGDIRLLRFLRKERKKDPMSAAIVYRKFLRWRAENNVDEIRAQVDNKPFEVPEELLVVSELIPCIFDSKENSNYTESTDVMISLSVGKFQTATLMKMIRNEEINLNHFLIYWVWKFESLHQLLYKESVKQQKMVFVDSIADLKGFSLQQISPAFVSRVLRPWIKQLQSNYPETAKKIVVTNPPHVFSLLWKLVGPLLSPGTAAKIRII